MLGLVSAVFLGSGSRGTHEHYLPVEKRREEKRKEKRREEKRREN
jgi:hypothetical protein